MCITITKTKSSYESELKSEQSFQLHQVKKKPNDLVRFICQLKCIE